MAACLSAQYEIVIHSAFSKAVTIAKRIMEQHAACLHSWFRLVNAQNTKWWVQFKSTEARQALSIKGSGYTSNNVKGMHYYFETT